MCPYSVDPRAVEKKTTLLVLGSPGRRPNLMLWPRFTRCSHKLCYRTRYATFAKPVWVRRFILWPPPKVGGPLRGPPPCVAGSQPNGPEQVALIRVTRWHCILPGSLREQVHFYFFTLNHWPLQLLVHILNNRPFAAKRSSVGSRATRGCATRSSFQTSARTHRSASLCSADPKGPSTPFCTPVAT